MTPSGSRFSSLCIARMRTPLRRRLRRFCRHLQLRRLRKSPSAPLGRPQAWTEAASEQPPAPFLRLLWARRHFRYATALRPRQCRLIPCSRIRPLLPQLLLLRVRRALIRRPQCRSLQSGRRALRWRLRLAALSSSRLVQDERCSRHLLVLRGVSWRHRQCRRCLCPCGINFSSGTMIIARRSSSSLSPLLQCTRRHRLQFSGRQRPSRVVAEHWAHQRPPSRFNKESSRTQLPRHSVAVTTSFLLR